MQRFSRIVMAILFLAAAVTAQSPEGSKSDGRTDPAAGPIKRPHLEVEVTLQNGAVMRGIVLNGALVEKPRRADFVVLPAGAKNRPGAGLRLWYYQELQGFIFLRYRRIRSVKVLRKLTEAQVLLRKKRIIEALAKKKSAAGPGTAKKPSIPDDGLTSAQRRLLSRFPPTRGWTTERYQTIQRNKILFGNDPEGDEAAWLKVYPEWLAARRLLEAHKKESAAPKAARLARKAKSPAARAKRKPTPKVKKVGGIRDIRKKAAVPERKTPVSGAGRSLNG